MVLLEERGAVPSAQPWPTPLWFRCACCGCCACCTRCGCCVTALPARLPCCTMAMHRRTAPASVRTRARTGRRFEGACGRRRNGSQDGSTSLMAAAQRGHLESARLLVERGASINVASQARPPIILYIYYYTYAHTHTHTHACMHAFYMYAFMHGKYANITLTRTPKVHSRFECECKI